MSKVTQVLSLVLTLSVVLSTLNNKGVTKQGKNGPVPKSEKRSRTKNLLFFIITGGDG